MNLRSRFVAAAATVLTIIVLAASIGSAIQIATPLTKSDDRSVVPILLLHPFVLLFPTLRAALTP